MSENENEPKAPELPAWASGGPTVYRTLMREAQQRAVQRPDILVDYVPPRFVRSVLGEVDAALLRMYVEGVQEGYRQAAILFDEKDRADG